MSVHTLAKKLCIHCGTAFRPAEERPDFCCAGCEFVHGLIKARGLTQYYELQDGANFPVKSAVFQQRDYTWLAELQRAKGGNLELDIQGISCIGCVWLIERLFERMPGAQSLSVDPALGRMWLRCAGNFDIAAFAGEVQSFGYLIGPPSEKAARSNRGLIVRLGLCGALAMNAMLFTLPSYLGMSPSFQFAALFSKVAFICGTLSFLIGGSYFMTRSWRSLRLGVLHIDLPISLGLIAAYAGSIIAWVYGAESFVYFDFISTFTFLMLVGRWTQEATVRANRNRLLDTTFDVAHPNAGDCYSVAPGQIVPVISKLRSESATLGMEWISGESETRTARAGQLVPSGAVNLASVPVELEATQAWKDSVLARLLEDAPQTDRRARGLERFIRIYLIVVLCIGAAAFAAWLLMLNDPLTSLQVLTSILVVSCPCAAGVALPLAEQVANNRARAAGVLVRENGLWARLPKVEKIIFDKTGTLTLETMALVNPGAARALRPEDRDLLLALVEGSLHPVGSCLREQLLAGGARPAKLGAVPVESVGAGIEVRENGSVYRLGKPGWAGAGEGDTLFTRDGEVIAAFSFRDAVREDAAEEFRALQAAGYELHILSGDRPGKVAAMAAQLGLSARQAQGGLSPDEKAEQLRRLGPERTLMIGDGANDSLAFNVSLCTGTPAIDRGLLERKADFYFLGRGLRGIRALIGLARRKQRVDRTVLGFAITYNAVAVGLSIAGLMTPLIAAIIMPLSGLVTIGLVLVQFRGE
jgi:P-type Cu2+ transporter